MSDNPRFPAPFEPLRPASRRTVIAGVILGPLLWLTVLIVAAALFESSAAIVRGLGVTVLSFLFSTLVLLMLRNGRRRQAKRYVDTP